MTDLNDIWIPRTNAGPWNRDESTTTLDLTSPTLLSNMSLVKKWCQQHHKYANAQPAIEVYNISIFNKSFIRNPQEKCQVYGVIRVVDNKDGRQCILYNRDIGDDHLDVISFHHTALTLTGPEVPISMKEPEIFIDIRDKANGASIFHGSGSLHNATIDEFEKVHCLTLPLEGGVVEVDVEYIALKFATAAVLEITPREVSEDESEEESIAIFGSISAYYNQPYLKPFKPYTIFGSIFGSISMRKSFCMKLFEKPPNDPQVVELESPMKLSKRVVVMPAYSSLMIDFDLKDCYTNQPVINGKLSLDTREYCKSWTDITSESNQNHRMHVSLYWKLPFVLDEASYDTSRIMCWDSQNLPNGMHVHAFLLVEIFSVIIGRHNDEELSLYGKVVVHDNGIGCNIFTATKKKPYVLLPGCKRLPLKCPPRTMKLGDHFSVSVKLRDVKQRLCINGYFNVSHGLTKHHKSWYDRRLCSVIKGVFQNGFAAVNYMVMSSSIKAVVKVSLMSKNPTLSSSGILSGKIVAFYGKYEYETDDDREYYRSVLFQGSFSTEHRHNNEVKLSRSVVPVPLDSSLHIGVDLKLQSTGGAADTVHEIVVFQPGGVEPSILIEGGKSCICVSVEWNNGRS